MVGLDFPMGILTLVWSIIQSMIVGLAISMLFALLMLVGTWRFWTTVPPAELPMIAPEAPVPSVPLPVPEQGPAPVSPEREGRVPVVKEPSAGLV